MECVSTPCLNGGTCDERHGSFMCDCVAGYTGGLCETGMHLFRNSNTAFAATCMSPPAETKQNACLGNRKNVDAVLATRTEPSYKTNKKYRVFYNKMRII